MKTCFLAEFAKFKKNKIVLFSIIAFFMVFVLLSYLLPLITAPNYNPKFITPAQYEELKRNNNLPEDAEKMLYYEAVSNSGLASEAYYEKRIVLLQEEFSWGAGKNGIAFTWILLKIFGIFTCIFAVILVFFVFSRDIVNGSIKNWIASDMSRKEIFLGKMFFSIAIIASLYIAYVLLSLVSSLGFLGIKVLFIYNGKAKLTTFGEVYLARAIEGCFAILAMLSLSILFALFPSNKVSVILPISVLGLFGVIYKVFSSNAINSINFRTYFYNFTPFYSSFFGTHFGFWALMISSTLFYILLSCALVYVAEKRFTICCF